MPAIYTTVLSAIFTTALPAIYTTVLSAIFTTALPAIYTTVLSAIYTTAPPALFKLPYGLLFTLRYCLVYLPIILYCLCLCCWGGGELRGFVHDVSYFRSGSWCPRFNKRRDSLNRVSLYKSITISHGSSVAGSDRPSRGTGIDIGSRDDPRRPLSSAMEGNIRDAEIRGDDWRGSHEASLAFVSFLFLYSGRSLCLLLILPDTFFFFVPGIILFFLGVGHIHKNILLHR